MAICLISLGRTGPFSMLSPIRWRLRWRGGYGRRGGALLSSLSLPSDCGTSTSCFFIHRRTVHNRPSAPEGACEPPDELTAAQALCGPPGPGLRRGLLGSEGGGQAALVSPESGIRSTLGFFPSEGWMPPGQNSRQEEAVSPLGSVPRKGLLVDLVCRPAVPDSS